MISKKATIYRLVQCEECGHLIAVDTYELGKRLQNEKETTVECAYCGHLTLVTNDNLTEGKEIIEVQ